MKNFLKRLSFLLFCFVSCWAFYFLVTSSWVMSLIWLEGDTSVLRWGAVIAISAVTLFLLWRNSKQAYKTLWKLENRKEKLKLEHSKRLEIDESEEIAENEETETFLDEKQSRASRA